MASDDDELKSALKDLFTPIAPGLVLFEAGGPVPAMPDPQPADSDAIVAWQHLGAGLGEVDRLYKSIRLNRAPAKPVGGDVGNIIQMIDAKPYRSMRIRLKAAVRAEVDRNSRAQLTLFVARPAGQPRGFSDNMADRPITSAEWSRYEVEGMVADDATTISVGGYLRGSGAAWFDAIELEVAPAAKGKWKAVALKNGGFEDGGAYNGWMAPARNYQYTTDATAPFAGKLSLKVEPVPAPEGPLFEAHTQPGDVVTKPLGSGLMMRMPLAVYSDTQGTLPHAAASILPVEEMKAIDPVRMDATDVRLRLADVVVTWNAIQHFYPYFDVVAVDWPSQLRIALRASLADSDAAAHLRTLQRLVAATRDGHGSVDGPGMTPRYWAPFRAQWIEDRAVIVQSLDERFHAGDIIVTVDGMPAADRVVEAEQMIAGSDQWRRLMAMNGFIMGDKDSAISIGLVRDGTPLVIEAQRTRPGPVRQLALPDTIAELQSGIWYVDLRNATADAIRDKLETLSTAKGLVFDLRGYPKDSGAAKILNHLINQPDSDRWMWMPEIVWPDHDAPLSLDGHGWELQPAPRYRFTGKIAFLTDANAISQSESILGYIEALKIPTVGSATAGANGDVRRFKLPGGYNVGFTGMRVTKHDGSPQHLVGVAPTVPVQPTIAGIKAGRDEVLERSLSIVADIN